MKTLSLLTRSIALLMVFSFHAFRIAAQPGTPSPGPITVYADVLDFDSLFLGTETIEPLHVTIQNLGPETVTYQITLSNPDFFHSQEGGPFTLFPGDFVDDNIYFRPTATGSITGVLTITTDDPENPVYNFDMSGVGLTRPIQESVVQDTVIEGSFSTKYLQLTNTTGFRAGFHFQSAQSFIQFPTNTYYLNSGESTLVELRINGFGLLVGFTAGSFEVSHLPGSGENPILPISVPVEVVVLEQSWGPVAVVSGGSNADFGPAFVGSSVGPIVVEISNPSPTPLICQIVSSDPNFTVNGPDSVFTVTDDDFFSFGYSFSPLSSGPHSGTITLTTNDPAHPVFTWHVAGEGLTAPFQIIEDTVQTDQQSHKLIWIQNTASIPLEFNLSPVQNDEHGTYLDLSITPEVISLPASAGGSFEVAFDATGFAPGVYYGAIGIQTGIYADVKVPVVITVTASGHGPVAEFYTEDIYLDSIFVTTKSYAHYFSFSNTGDEPLIVSVTSSNPRFFVLNYNGPFTIMPGESDTTGVAVDFNPLEPGADASVITISTNDPNLAETTLRASGVGLAYPLGTTLLTDTLSTGDTTHQQVLIKNTTFTRGEFYLLANPFYGIEVPDPSHFLEAGDSTLVDVYFNAHMTSSGIYPGLIELYFYPANFGYTKSINLNTLMVVDDDLPVIEAPDSLHVEIPIGTMKTTSFTLGNSGEAELNYFINYNTFLSDVGGPRLYSTGFEEFTEGPIHGKGGWYSAIYVFFNPDDRWVVDHANPYSGSKHLRYTSDIINTSEKLFSPASAIAETDFSIIDMMVDVELGVTWTIVAESPSWGFSGNALIVFPDGSLGIDEDYAGIGEITPISGSIPTGYFNLRFSVNKNTGQFSVAVDDEVIFTGTSSTTVYSEISFAGGAEMAGATLDVDNIRFIDDANNIRFITIFPEDGAIGSIPPDGSGEVIIRVDARNIDPGTYLDTLTVVSLDTSEQFVKIPLTTVVPENSVPVLTGVTDTTMVSGEVLSLTFSATDADDSLVAVTGFNIMGGASNFQEVTDSGNGFVTYTFTTDELPIDSWYDGMILARDPRGGISSLYFRIHVLAHKANDFALTNFKTGVDVAVFTDTVVVDIAHPDLSKLTIQFKPDVNYGAPDGVKFILDGTQTNTDSGRPYYINSWLIPNLSEGYHSLTAVSFYVYEGVEYTLATRKTIIKVINSAAITDFDLVNASGIKIMDLENGSVIDIGQPGFSAINIVANTSINTVRSVRFVTGNITIRIDNRAPYAMRGNANGTDTVWPAQPGFYTISAIPYMMYYGWGPRGVPLTVSFQIIRSASPAVARASDATDEIIDEESPDGKDLWSVYPVPAEDHLTIELSEKITGDVGLQILNAQGRSIYSRTDVADAFRKHSLSTNELGMTQGMFFVILQQNNGRRFVKKIVKK